MNRREINVLGYLHMAQIRDNKDTPREKLKLCKCMEDLEVVRSKKR